MRIVLLPVVLSLFVSSTAWAPPRPVLSKISSALSAVRLNYADEPSSELESSVVVDKDLSSLQTETKNLNLSSSTPALNEPRLPEDAEDVDVCGPAAIMLESLLTTTMETVYFRRIAMHTSLFLIQQQVHLLKSLDFPQPYSSKIAEMIDEHSFKGDLGMSQELITFLLSKLETQGTAPLDIVTEAQECMKRLRVLQTQLLESVETEISVVHTAQLVALAGSTLLWTRQHPVLVVKYWDLLASSYTLLNGLVENLNTPHAKLFTTAFDYDNENTSVIVQEASVEEQVTENMPPLDEEQVAFPKAMDSVSEGKKETKLQVEPPKAPQEEVMAKTKQEQTSSSATTHKSGNDLFGNVVGAFGNLVNGTLHAVREYNDAHKDDKTTKDAVASTLPTPSKATNATTSGNDAIQASSKSGKSDLKTESKVIGESNMNETFAFSKSDSAPPKGATSVKQSEMSEPIQKEPLSEKRATKNVTARTLDSFKVVPELATAPDDANDKAVSQPAKSDSVTYGVSPNSSLIGESSTRAVVNATFASEKESKEPSKTKMDAVSDTNGTLSKSHETTVSAAKASEPSAVKQSLNDVLPEREEATNTKQAEEPKPPVVASESTTKSEVSKSEPESASDRIRSIRQRRELNKLKKSSTASSKDAGSTTPVVDKASSPIVDKTPTRESKTASTIESEADIKSRTLPKAPERTASASAVRDLRKSPNAMSKVETTVPSSTSPESDPVKGIPQKAAPKMSENRERLNSQARNQPMASGERAPPNTTTKAGERLRPSNVTSAGARNFGAPNAATRATAQPSTPRRSNATSVTAGGVSKATERPMPPRVDPRSAMASNLPKAGAKSFPPTNMRDPRTISPLQPVTTGSKKVTQRESMPKPINENVSAGINTRDIREEAPTMPAPRPAVNIPTKNGPTVASQKAVAANGVGRVDDTRATRPANQPPATVTSPKSPVPAEAIPPVVLERSMFTKEKPVCMPNMGKFQAKVVRWYKTKGQRVEHNDLLCDIETEDFTFGVVKEDEGPAFMGEIIAQADTEGVQDGDLLCMLLHPEIPKVPQQNPVAADVPRADAPAAAKPVPVQDDEPAETTLKISAQPKIDKSMCTKKMSIRMPNMGGSQAKVVKWYKKEGDRVDFKDLICDIESGGSIFTISNEDEITAFMGKISVAADSQGVQPGDLLCTVFLGPKAGQSSSNEGQAGEKSEVPAQDDVKKTPTELKMEEQAQRLPPGATITMAKKASGESTNTSSIEQELPPGATMIMASAAAEDIDISIFKDLDDRNSNKLMGGATITMPDGMSTAKPEANVQSQTADDVEPTADGPPLPIPDVTASNDAIPVPIIGDVSPPSASTDATSPPSEGSTKDSVPPVELDRSMFTKEKPINMPNMGKFRAKIVRWYKNPGDKVAFNDLLCDIETEDFTFGVINEEDVPAYMGDIVVPADTEGLQDGDLLCHLLHPPAGATLNTRPPASAAPANEMPSDPIAAGTPANGMGVSPPVNVRGSESQTRSWNGIPQDPMASQPPGFGSQSQFPSSRGNLQETPSEATPPVLLDQSLYTREMPIRMPNMGKYDAKVVRWYKQKGDPVEFNDVLCDIVTEDFTFGMVNEEENTALMGEIAVPAGSDRIHDGDLLCTLMHLEQGTSSNVGAPRNLNDVARAATDIKVKTGRGEFSDRATGMPNGRSNAPRGIDSPPAHDRDPASSARTPSNSIHVSDSTKAGTPNNSAYSSVGTPRTANGAGRVDDTRPRRARAPKQASSASDRRTSPRSPAAGPFPGRSPGVANRTNNGNSPAAFGLGSINEVPRITKPANSPDASQNPAANEPTAFGLGKTEKNLPKPKPKTGSTAGTGYLDNMNSGASAPDWSKAKAPSTGGGSASGHSHLSGLTGSPASSKAPSDSIDRSSDKRERANNGYSSSSETDKTTRPGREVLNRGGPSNAVPDFSQSGSQTSDRDPSTPPVDTNGWPDWSQPMDKPASEASEPASTTVASPQANTNGWPDWSQPLQETVLNPAPSFPPEVKVSTETNRLELEAMPIHMPETGTDSKAKVVKWYKKEGDVVAFNDVICDIETDEFTFNMVNEDDVDALMGEIFVSEGDDVLHEGALLCTVFLPKEELYDDEPRLP